MFKLWVVFLLLGSPTASRACRADFDEAPTNIELLERADLVVLAKLVGTSNNTEMWDKHIVLEPLRALKGTAPPNLTISGFIRDRESGEPIRSFPTALGQSHPSSAWGTCNRAAYSPGALVLAIFERTPDGLRESADPWARSIEDVEGPDGLWVRAATLYLRIISQNPPRHRRKAFEKERERLLASPEEPDSKAIAEDIGWYLAATSAEGPRPYSNQSRR